MANFLNRFNKDLSGSSKNIHDYLAKVSGNGDFKKVKNIDVIISSWTNILLTRKRTYLHDPNYGSDLFKLIFEPVDNTTVEKIKNEIYNSIGVYDNRASIRNIDVILKSNGKGFQVNVTVFYDGDTKELSLTFDERFQE